tara:strand:- start:13014 stop:13445 length:432 start_codon:yes stop_codon:yes gene_type:complete
MGNLPLFHLAFPVTDLEKSRDFYCNILGCSTGRESARWIDFNFFGHQLVAHLVETKDHPSVNTNQVDGCAIPASHFGVILEWKDYKQLASKLEKTKVDFVIDPHLRFKDQVGEQATFFICDPSNNYLEFKAFRTLDMLFRKNS